MSKTGEQKQTQPESESLLRRLPVLGPISKLYDKYDSTFLTMLGF